jgi:hypothetical protein
MFAVTYDPTAPKAAKMFVDGSLVYEETVAQPNPIRRDWGADGRGGVCLRFRQGGGQRDGIAVDDLSVWTRALTADEIARMAQAGGLAVSPVGKAATSWGLLKRR